MLFCLPSPPSQVKISAPPTMAEKKVMPRRTQDVLQQDRGIETLWLGGGAALRRPALSPALLVVGAPPKTNVER
jgi:hypothetical protein